MRSIYEAIRSSIDAEGFVPASTELPDEASFRLNGPLRFAAGAFEGSERRLKKSIPEVSE